MGMIMNSAETGRSRFCDRGLVELGGAETIQCAPRNTPYLTHHAIPSSLRHPDTPIHRHSVTLPLHRSNSHELRRVR
jgi:hypothetical protein